jgi:hypothetical protein
MLGFFSREINSSIQHIDISLFCVGILHKSYFLTGYVQYLKGLVCMFWLHIGFTLYISIRYAYLKCLDLRYCVVLK